MSALDGWIDVCRTGSWRDASNREVTITEATLDGIVAAYPAQDPAPVVVGHPETDAPAYGWVAAVRRSGDRLQAKVRDLMPAFRGAVEAGRYTARSIAIVGGGLRHLAFLGGRAPAVPGLAPTQFAAAPAPGAVMLSAPLSVSQEHLFMSGTSTPSNAAVAAEARTIQAEFAARGETLSSIAAVDMANARLTAARRAYSGALASGDSPRQTRSVPDRYRIEAMREVNGAKESVLHPREMAYFEALLGALLARPFSVRVDHPDNAGAETMEAATILQLFLQDKLAEQAPSAMSASAARRTPAPATGPSNERIAAEARTLMSEAAGRGETLLALEAVRRVRLKYGLPTGN